MTTKQLRGTALSSNRRLEGMNPQPRFGLEMISLGAHKWALAALTVALLTATTGRATPYYWDNNGNTAGFGTANGTWAAPTTGDSTQGWSTSNTGGSTPGSVTTAATDALNFGTAAYGLATGTVTISGTVNAYGLTVGSASGAITLSGGIITLAAQTAGIANNSSSVLTINSDITLSSGSPSVRNVTGKVTLNGNTTGAGSFTPQAGATLTLAGNGTSVGLGGTGTIIVNAANLSWTGGYSCSGILDLNGNNFTVGNMSSSGGTITDNSAGSGTTTLTTTDQNTLTFSGTIADGANKKVAFIHNGSGTLTLSVANTFSGNTKVAQSSKKLTLGNNLAIQNSAIDTSGAGLFVLGTGITTPTIGGLSGSKNLSSVFDTTYSTMTGITLNTVSGQNLTYSGNITEGAAGMTLTKSGSGTQTLSGASTYTGNTTISQGTLALNGSGSIANSPVITVNGTFDVSALSGGFTLGPSQTLNGTNTVVGAVTINGTLAPGNSVGQLNTGAQTWAPGGTYTWEIANATGNPGTDWDFLNITGNLTITAINNPSGSANQFTIKLVSPGGGPTGFNGANNYTWTIATVSGQVDGFTAAKFILDLTGFSGTYNGSYFSVVLQDKSVVVVYHAPCTYATTAGSALVNGGTQMQMTFENLGGLSSVQALTLDNCTLDGTAYDINGVALLPNPLGLLSQTLRTTLPATTTKVVLLASKVNSGNSASVNAIAIDTCGLGKSFDPVLTTLTVASGNQVQQRFTGIIAAEHYLHVINGAPGLKWLEVVMNGHKFRLDPLADGAEVSADLRSAMIEGDNNVVVLTGSGPVGASAFVTISDTPTGNLVQLREVAELALARSGDRVEISWLDTLTGWQLQSSGGLMAGWADVPATPVAANGRLTVSVAAGAGAQFFRLTQSAGAAAQSAPGLIGRTAGAALNNNNITNPQPEQTKSIYDGLHW